MNANPNKISLNIDGDTKVSIKGFIAPIEHTLSNHHVAFEWDELANLQVAAPEKMYSASVFRAFLPHGVVSVGDLWQIEETGRITCPFEQGKLFRLCTTGSVYNVSGSLNAFSLKISIEEGPTTDNP